MRTTFTLSKAGRTIEDLSSWRAQALPKGGARQWQPGRSAYELAAAWCGQGSGAIVPEEILRLLDSHPDTRGVQLVVGTPEHRIAIDDLRGETRNADIALHARHGDAAVAITVEAKVDEPYGPEIGKRLADVVEQKLLGKRSNAAARVETLAAALLPPWRRGLPHLAELRYQLLTATAGTLAFAGEIGARSAILVIHEFVTDRASDDRRRDNQRALDLFSQRVSSGDVKEVRPGELVGPLQPPGAPLFLAPPVFYLGKAVRDVRTKPGGR